MNKEEFDCVCHRKVIEELYCIDEHIINPGNANSNLNIIDNDKPIDPPIKPNIIYNHPI